MTAKEFLRRAREVDRWVDEEVVDVWPPGRLYQAAQDAYDTLPGRGVYGLYG